MHLRVVSGKQTGDSSTDRGEYLVELAQHERSTSLASGVGTQMCGDSIVQLAAVKHRPEFSGDELAYVPRSSRKFVNELFATVEDRDDVRDVSASQEITVSAATVGL